MNNRHIQYFVICHDQDIILSNKFNFNHKWIFVGHKDTDKLNGLNNVVIAKNLPDNIEQMPGLCSFTGWYAITKNPIVDPNHSIALLEYDIDYSKLDSLTKTAIINRPSSEVFGYKCIPCGYLVFTKSTPWLEIGLQKIYGINLEKIFPDLPKVWIGSTNVCFKSAKILYDFVDWFMPLAEFCADKPMGGYVHERALHIFLSLYYPNIIACVKNNIAHQEQRSHKQKDVCDICKEMEQSAEIHHCIKWLYKNLLNRYTYE